VTQGKILVIGSINYDFLLTQDRLPRRGETLVAKDLKRMHGGKGANQAVQSARLGAAVEFIGAVGDDEAGRLSRENFSAEGILTLLKESTLATGIGLVHVVGDGEVYATIYEGANSAVDRDWIFDHAARMSAADVVIIQNEIPVEANAAAVEVAGNHGIPVVYNAAPARPVPTEVTQACAWFIVNEDEAAYYLGRPLGDPAAVPKMIAAAEEIRHRCARVVLTLGRHGCVVSTERGSHHIPSLPAAAVDTTGAGDSFVGAFAVAISEGADELAAARIATRVASLTVQGFGAQTSMPMRDDVGHETVLTPAADS